MFPFHAYHYPYQKGDGKLCKKIHKDGVQTELANYVRSLTSKLFIFLVLCASKIVLLNGYEIGKDITRNNVNKNIVI
jgi:hypothetical protein